MTRWPDDLETAARWVGPYGAAASTINPRIRAAQDKLRKMPARCERCGRGGPVYVLGGDMEVVAVCATCRGGGGGATDRERVWRFKAAQAETARDTARIERGMRARRLVGFVNPALR